MRPMDGQSSGERHFLRFVRLRLLLHGFDGLVGCPDGVGEEGVVDEGGGIAVTPLGVFWAGGCVFDDSDLETLLEQVSQVRFDADVG